MQTPPKLSPDTVARMTDELLHTSLDAQRRQAIAALLDALILDMTPMRSMDVGDTEPAAIYDASQP
jgi:hypothetical protein